jgi:hypothetical protein
MVTVSSLAAGAAGAPACAAHHRGHARALSRTVKMVGNKSLLGMMKGRRVKTGASFFSHPTLAQRHSEDDENLMKLEMKTCFISKLRRPAEFLCDHNHQSA